MAAYGETVRIGGPEEPLPAAPWVADETGPGGGPQAIARITEASASIAPTLGL